MKIEVGFGEGIQAAEVPEKAIIKILKANPVKNGPKGEAAVKKSLAEPIGAPRLREVVKPGEKIAIITSDITRPLPTWEIMPALLDELYGAGIRKEDITLVFALGSHRPHSEKEKRHLAGERAYCEIRCVDSDPEDFVHMGITEAGTPVDITRIVAEADRRICLGNIEYHYFAGYSGGAKAIMPGVSTPAAIQANHSMMIQEKACAGNLEDNPIRKDLEEAAAMCRVDYIINVILDEHKNIVYSVAGDFIRAHRKGCRFLDSLYQVKIPKRADIVIASQGGAPKDLNLYQTQKALDNAKHAVREGGTIILTGSCREGLGQETFSQWMTEAKRPEDLITRIKKQFRLGGHKAAAIAMVLKKAQISLVSDMEGEFVKTIFMEPYKDLQSAFDAAVKRHGKNAEVIVMPYGGSTLPKVEK
ncbi:nickel-dependent lactate racemase [Anaerovorax odorimutans]|uniref:Nickel-dependent lactate racemase n=1 Tax=Anaerovorax odorimutans TaxID=109327 RepID=A0ABT1RRQ6_9FIRM|nr:nickel-dependent lactate racemase [Anaerovorax odorimutans]MCQ4637855.1 nickel-dependent lactate racemase [Anaerovorax odorimutans]